MVDVIGLLEELATIADEPQMAKKVTHTTNAIDPRNTDFILFPLLFPTAKTLICILNLDMMNP